jgi:hypothetical protein
MYTHEKFIVLSGNARTDMGKPSALDDGKSKEKA